MLNNKLIVINNDSVINVINIEDNFYYGYDIINEEFKRVSIKDSIQFSKTLIKLLGCQNTRTKIAINLTDSETEATKILKTSKKTLNRTKHKLKLI